MKIGIINEGEDFIFQLTTQEVEELSRCKNFTLNRGTGRGSNIKYNPCAFTEQGIRQSRALVRTFKQIKDYIVENQEMYNKLTCVKLTSSFI